MQLINHNGNLVPLGSWRASKLLIEKSDAEIAAMKYLEARNLERERRNQERNRSGVSKWFWILWKRPNMSVDKKQIIG